MPHKDQVYIEALLANDSKTIEEIYALFSNKIIGFVQKNSGTNSEAKDIFQEALITIYNSAKHKNLQLSCPFDAYLYMVCRSKWLNILKSKRRKNVTIIDIDGYTITQDLKDETDSSNQYEHKMNLMEQKFELLGDSCKKILRLSWKGISMNEVANLVNVSYAYARKKKSECTAKLMQFIKDDPMFQQINEE